MIHFVCRYYRLSLLLVALLSLAGNIGIDSAAAEPLVWKFAEGDQHHFQMVQETMLSMDLGVAGEVTTEVKQTFDITWEVESVAEDGAAQLTQRITRVQMAVNAPGQADLSYDTDLKEQPQGYAAMLAPTIEALRSSPIKATMTPRGEISDVEIPEALIEAISRGSAGAVPGSLGTSEGYLSFFQQNSIVLPEEANLQENKIDGWRIKVGGGITALIGGARGVIIPHQFVKAISDIFIINKGALPSPDTEIEEMPEDLV